MTNKNDKTILALKAEIDKKKTAIGTASRFVPKTNCNLELFGMRINIHTLTCEQLVQAIGVLAAIEIGTNARFVTKPGDTSPITISGHSVEDWLGDLEARYKTLDINNEKARLKVLEEKLHNLLSTDTKVSLELDDLAKQI